MISITPIKIAINAKRKASNFINARGSKRCGKKVSANEIGPPSTVKDIKKAAKSASDSITKT